MSTAIGAAQGMNRPGATAPAGATVSSHRRLGTVILEAGEAVDDLVRNLESAMAGMREGRHRVIILCRQGRETELVDRLGERFAGLDVTDSKTWWRRPAIDTPWLAFLPANGLFSPPLWYSLPEQAAFLKPWIPPIVPRPVNPTILRKPSSGWIASPTLLPDLVDEASSDFGLAAVLGRLGRRRVPVRYLSAPATPSAQAWPAPSSVALLRRDAAILA